jgi:hypothetical protein
MKKLLVVLLSLGLIVAFSAAASATEMKIGGKYEIEGAYLNNPTVVDEGGYSRAAFWQRVRFEPVFTVADGLTFTARMDALEKQWGNTTWRTGQDDLTSSRVQTKSTTVANNSKIQENFEWERGYMTFKTKYGTIQAGYQVVDQWGTQFNDANTTRPKVLWSNPFGAFTLMAVYEKVYDHDYVNGAITGKVDADIDTYALAGIYRGKGIEAGLLYKYYNSAYQRLAATPYRQAATQVSPYLKATFGPVYVESEIAYWFGKAAKYDDAGTNDVDIKSWGAYLKGQYNMGPAYFGAQFLYTQGNDFTDASKTNDKGDGTNATMAKDWNPTLIMLGDSYLTDILPGGSAYDSGNFSSKKNALAGMVIYNFFGGFNPTPKLNVEMGLTFASFDKKPRVGNTLAGAEYVSNTIGTELDLTATYKIYDNLSYMVGAGYLWTGDAFKANNAAAKVGNDYVLLNALKLTF